MAEALKKIQSTFLFIFCILSNSFQTLVSAVVPCESVPAASIPAGVCVTDGLGGKNEACNNFLPLSESIGSNDYDGRKLDNSIFQAPQTSTSQCLVGSKFDSIREEIGLPARLAAAARSFVPTIEIHGWSSQAIQQHIVRILLEEMLGYSTTRAIFNPDLSTFPLRARDPSCYSIDIERWAWATINNTDESLIFEFLGVIGRDGLYVPKGFSTAASHYRILMEGISFECHQHPTDESQAEYHGDGTFLETDYATSYSLYPPMGTTNMSALFESPEDYPCNQDKPEAVQWTNSTCTNGAYVPPQCMHGELCAEMYLISPDWNPGWHEAVITNLGLRFVPIYLGVKNLYDRIAEFHSAERDGHGIVYFAWEPSPLHLKYPAQSFIIPEYTDDCKEGYLREPLQSQVDCNTEPKPLMKIFPSALKLAEPDLYHLWSSFVINRTHQMEMMTLEGPAMGGPGNLTIEQTACEWLRNNSEIWRPWLKIKEVVADDTSSSGMDRDMLALSIAAPAVATLLLLTLAVMWRRTVNLQRKLSNTVHNVRKPILDLEAPLNKAIDTLNDIIEGKRMVSTNELETLKLTLTKAGQNIAAPNFEQLVKERSDYYSLASIKFIMNMNDSGGQRKKSSFVDSQLSNAESSFLESNNEWSRGRSSTQDPKSTEVESTTAANAALLSSTGSLVLSRPSSLTERAAKQWSFFGRLLLDVPRHPFQPTEDTALALQMGAGEDFSFDTIELASRCLGKSLTVIGMYLIDTKFDLVNRLKLNRSRLRVFLTEVEQGHDQHNPYHNSIHAADVTQRFATIFTKCRLRTVFSDLDLLTGLLAGILHDFQHPGTNNSYQVHIRSSVAIHFNDQHVLENHSLYQGLSLLQPGKETNFLEDSGLSKSQMNSLRSTLIAMVLATDMAMHFTVLANFKAKVLSGGNAKESFNDSKITVASLTPRRNTSASNEGRKRRINTLELTEEERLLIMRMGLKCADIGHVTLPVDSHILWVKSLQEEFYKQGDKERSRGRVISFLCDREKPRNGPAYGENQLGFLDLICEPMYKAWAKLFPECDALLEFLKCNHRYWETDARTENSTDSIERIDV